MVGTWAAQTAVTSAERSAASTERLRAAQMAGTTVAPLVESKVAPMAARLELCWVERKADLLALRWAAGKAAPTVDLREPRSVERTVDTWELRKAPLRDRQSADQSAAQLAALKVARWAAGSVECLDNSTAALTAMMWAVNSAGQRV